MDFKRKCRLGFIIITALLTVSVGVSYASSLGGGSSAEQGSNTSVSRLASVAAEQSKLPFSDRDPIAPPRNNVTVMTGQGFGDRPGDALIALAPDGRVLYYNDSHAEYQDVDPSPEGKSTVLYVASDYLNKTECDASVNCVRDVVERVNLSTGETDRIYSFTAPDRVNQKMHDVDRIGENRLLIADIAYDRVAIVNTTTGIVEWQWEAQQAFPFSGGGDYPSDWTHVNDVEHLPDGRIMASLRNQDQVIFLDRDRGLQSNWTLGAENDYSTLFEQHNPDYVPAADGGPAVLVSDSHNNRIVEYERSNGSWRQTWVWTDEKMQWPRDADRLPNGHTLIVDSNGGRLLEIDRDGEIVWTVKVKSLYEAERLGTGDESAGGTSATKANLTSENEQRTDSRPESTETTVTEAADSQQSFSVRSALRGLIPLKLWNGIAFVLPAWTGILEVIALCGILFTGITWVLAELYWTDKVTLHNPIRINNR